jgi:hypothetical protein
MQILEVLNISVCIKIEQLLNPTGEACGLWSEDSRFPMLWGCAIKLPPNITVVSIVLCGYPSLGMSHPEGFGAQIAWLP